MATIYAADSDESTFLREVFGQEVTDVCFWDAESGRGRFVEVVGRDSTGADLRSITAANRKIMSGLREMAAVRGETVKFWLEVPAAD